VASAEVHGCCGFLQLGEPLFQFLGLDRFDTNPDRVKEHLGDGEVCRARGDALGDLVDCAPAVGRVAEPWQIDGDRRGFTFHVGLRGCNQPGAQERAVPQGAGMSLSIAFRVSLR
jgi:hypothetical protein